MSVGGATFATAGTLEFGSGNTFDLGDVTEAGVTAPYNHAWWSYTPAGTVTLILDTFASTSADPDLADTLIYVYEGATLVASNDDAPGGNPDGPLLSRLIFTATDGVTYHIMVGTFHSGGDTLTTYRLTVAETTLTPIASSYSIPGRPTAPRGGTSSASPAVINPNQVSSPTPLSVGGGGWWSLTPDIDGRLSLDAFLSYTTGDRVRDETDPRVFVWIYAADGTTVLTVDGNGIDPDLGVFCNRGQIDYDFTGGTTYLIRLESVSGWPAATVFLRVSDYAPTTGWLDTDDVEVITAPPDEMGWSSPLPDDLAYPGTHAPAILPTPVLTVEDPSDTPVERYLQPYGPGYGFEGAAEMQHYPQDIGDPGYGVYPYQDFANWMAIWGRAVQGHWTSAYDFGPDAGESSEFGFDADGYWDNNRIFSDWPVGYRVSSSAVDATPPDGHQTIGYEVWAYHWHVKVSALLYDYPSHNAVLPWVTSEVPDDSPGDGYDLQWDAAPGDPATVKSLAVASNPDTTDATFAAGDFLDGFYWDARGKTLTWAGDGSFENGHWYQDFDPDVPPPGDGGDIFRGVDYVAGVPDVEGVERHGYFGPGPIPAQGEALTSWLADNDDWHTLLASEAAVEEYLAVEAPGLPDADSGYTDPGSILLSAIPAVMMIDGALPDNGIYNTVHLHASARVFLALKAIYARPRHRWVGTPVIPAVVSLSGIPPRRIFQRSDAKTHGAARVGKGNTRQSGSRTLGAIL